ncbi:beta-ketoacyl synthase N-terminal-like domain-containing protein [Qaidamihabitans albus]|uniref:beta-ketoacyl synthase N-terminal-like domain-containing protein n=1 Tax=Qaidamihabitans albus TaxID=2795733 RepID=UPI001F171F6D|nr:beta-ketoacyl synthase N-terminal-like domain-containing protein [Qaidamihabitans albus]
MTRMTAVITAWSAISACGVGRAPFAGGMQRGWASSSVLDGPEPGTRAFLASAFDIEHALGRKGTGSMDRASGLAIGAVGELLAEVDVDTGAGIVLGTTSGSAQTQFDFTRDSLTRRRPYFVNPASMPFALMNSAASQCAIWHRLTGPNTSIAGGRMSGLSVLRYASRLLTTGRAGAVVCGAVEEYSTARAWLERHRGGRRVLGEGAAMLLVEPADAGRRPLAEVLGIETRIAVAGEVAGPLAECVRRVLERAGVGPGDVGAHALSAAEGEFAVTESAAVEAVLGRPPATVLSPAEVIGDVGAAIGPFQVAALLEAPGLGLATALDEDGTVGCGLFRVLS